jgi:hypothetical protein
MGWVCDLEQIPQSANAQIWIQVLHFRIFCKRIMACCCRKCLNKLTNRFDYIQRHPIGPIEMASTSTLDWLDETAPFPLANFAKPIVSDRQNKSKHMLTDLFNNISKQKESSVQLRGQDKKTKN